MTSLENKILKLKSNKYYTFVAIFYIICHFSSKPTGGKKRTAIKFPSLVALKGNKVS
jgi:hypothetical protein